MDAIRSGSLWRMSQSAAPVAASPASFQPEKAATSSGRRRPDARSQTRPSVIESAYGRRLECRDGPVDRRRVPRVARATAARSGTAAGAFPTSSRSPTCASRSTTPRSTTRSATIRSTATSPSPRIPTPASEYSAYYAIPRSSEDLLARSRLIETVTGLGGTMVTLVKEIGSDALFGLLRVLEGEALERARAFYEHCRDGDLVGGGRADRREGRPLAAAARSRPIPTSTCTWSRSAPTASSCAARSATRASAPTPTRSSCCRPGRWAPTTPTTRCRSRRRSNTPGLSLFVSAYGARDHDAFEFPISSKHKMLETLTVFDDVFVPWERVFLCREPELAGTVSSAFVEFHRFTAVSYKLPLLDALVGTAGADRGDERRRQGRPHPREAHPAHHLRRDRARAHRHGGAPRPRSASTASPTPTRSPPTWPSTPSPRSTTPRSSWCRTAPAGCSSPARAAPTGPTPRCARCWRSSTWRKAPGRGAAAPAQHDQRPHRPRLRRLPRGARGARRGLDRGREDADLPGLRARSGGRLRPPARGLDEQT